MIKVSRPKITAQIVSIKTAVDIGAVFDKAPTGFTEVAGYDRTFRKPVARYVTGSGWIGDAFGIKKVLAKKGKQTVSLTSDTVEVLGAGNFEAALLACVKNGWAPRSLLRAEPTYKKIDGQFNVNKDFVLEELASELKGLPPSFGPEVRPFEPELFPAVVLRLKKLGWTYQFFKNGTVLFSGLKHPKDLDLVPELFKKFFTDFGVSTLVFAGTSPRIGMPKAAPRGNKLAERYKLAGTWNRLRPAPDGYYIRPGTDGKPRLYPWILFERRGGGFYGEFGEVHRENVPIRKMNLKAVAPKVAAAFKKAGRPIPAATAKVFANAGYPLNTNENENGAGPVTGHANRRAPSWNATRNGFYVRPGPGQQPYWFKIPKGIASGRKTVISTYTKAGRNIPKAVRNIFKIGNNVQTAGEARVHRVVMGLDGILRINNRQATRLTKKELLAIARNMNIPEANAKATPATLIERIRRKANVGQRPNRTYDVLVNGMFYKFLNAGRLERTTGAGIRTTRNWTTIPVAEQNKLAAAIIPENIRAEWNGVAKANRFNTLRAVLASKKPAKVPSPPRPAPTPSPSSASSSVNNNTTRELEYAVRLAENLGNAYKNGNESNFLKIYKALPLGKRGKVPLKANVNRAYKKFVKETKGLRKNEGPRAAYRARITVPNWMPTAKANSYKNFVTNLVLAKPKKSQKDIKAAVRAWMNREVPQSPARAARNIENMVTGEIRHVPAYAPVRRPTPNIPKRT